MPKKVLPDAAAFDRFTERMEKRGFRRLSSGEFKSDFRRLQLEAPSPRHGREVGFIFTANNLTVFVWSTFLAQEGVARETDAGWVLIREGDKVKYFAHPLSRTKNFLRNLLGYASAARLRVLNRPLCPECGKLMDIAQGKALKARYWKCVNPAVHKRATTLSWDHGLPQEALDFLAPRRKRRAMRRDQLRRDGVRPDRAMLSRKPWRVGRPENIVRLR